MTQLWRIGNHLRWSQRFKVTTAWATHLSKTHTLCRPYCLSHHAHYYNLDNAQSLTPNGRDTRLCHRYFSSQPNSSSTNVLFLSQLGIRHELIQALQRKGFMECFPVQINACKSILKRQDSLIMAETGSGKTLAYLLPIIELLKRDEIDKMIATRPKRPRAIVIVPTRELAHQINTVTKDFTHYAKFSSGTLAGGNRSLRDQKKDLNREIDILVATPGRLLSLWQQNAIALSDVRYVILDEADTLLHGDTGFETDMRSLLVPLQKQHHSVQFVLAAATADKNVKRTIRKIFPNIREVVQPTAHRGPEQLDQHFVRVAKAGSQKHDALLDAVKSFNRSISRELVSLLDSSDVSISQSEVISLISNEETSEPVKDILPTKTQSDQDVQRMVRQIFPRTIVFCNTTQSVRSTGHILSERGIQNVCLHRDMPPKVRETQFNRFLRGDIKVLVCTDAAARGLDFHNVGHVINFDFPYNPVDYLHRAGRTARAGTPGVCTSLVTKRDEVLAKAIDAATVVNLPLVNLSSDRRAYPGGVLHTADVPDRAPRSDRPKTLRRRMLPSKRRELIKQKSREGKQQLFEMSKQLPLQALIDSQNVHGNIPPPPPKSPHAYAKLSSFMQSAFGETNLLPKRKSFDVGTSPQAYDAYRRSLHEQIKVPTSKNKSNTKLSRGRIFQTVFDANWTGVASRYAQQLKQHISFYVKHNSK